MANPFRKLDRAAAIGDAAADGCRSADRKRAARTHGTRPHRNHSAERVGAVGDRARPARDVDAIDRRRIEKRRARTHAALGGDTCAVDQHQHAPARHAADRRDGGVALRHLADARDGFERLQKMFGRSLRDLGRRQHGCGRRRRGVNARRGADDGDRLLRDGIDLQRDIALERGNVDRPRDLTTGQHDDHLKRRRRGRHREVAVGVALGADRRSGDRHHGAGDGRTRLLIEDPAAERFLGLQPERGRGEQDGAERGDGTNR